MKRCPDTKSRLFSLDAYLNQRRPISFKALPQRPREIPQAGRSRTGYPHTLCQQHPVEIGTADIEHVQGARSRISGTEIRKFTLKDSVGPVCEDHGRYVKTLARHGP